MPDRDNDEYDDNLREIYRMMYRLGTPKTKQDLEQMGLVKALGLNQDEMPQELKNPAAGQVEDPPQGPLEGILER